MRKLLIILSILLVFLTITACGDSPTMVENNSLEIGSVDIPGDLEDPIDEVDNILIEDDVVVTDDTIVDDTALYEVVRVVDGDTIVVSINDTDEKVRLIGVDTPESVHSDSSNNTGEGIVASDFTKELLSNKSVALEFDVSERDRYGRLLAYVYLDGEMVNKILLKEGYAQVATYPPNVKYVDDFILLQREARNDGVGLWGIVPEKTVDTPIQGNSSEYRLIGSRNSNKYHKGGYTHNGQIADHNLVYFKSVEDAISKKYISCKVCFK